MDEPYFMDAVITPHRSLSSRGFIVLIAVLTVINAASAGFFLWIGAGPVPIFLGFDLMAVIVAFRVSNRSASRQERVQVTAAEVRVVLQSPRETRLLWASPTAFTRVAMLGEPGDEDDLHIHLSDQRLRLAVALSRPERLAFAHALETAIRRARSGQGP
jgi:uncharacterized membrane protein